MIVTLLAAHEGLVRFYPILGSKGLALAINHAQQASPVPDDLIIIDGELTSGSTLIFYTGQQVHLINGRVNGLWYGSFWPDAPRIFETEEVPPSALGQPTPHLPLHLQPRRPHTRPHPLRRSPHPRNRRRQNRPHQPMTPLLISERACTAHPA